MNGNTNGFGSVAKLAALTMLMVGLLVTGIPPAAQAATSGPCYYNSSTTCYPRMSTNWAPWMSPWGQGSQYWTVTAGTRVDMRCWTTGAYKLNTSKWFYVRSQSYPFTQGYVPANAVTSQVSVGHC